MSIRRISELMRQLKYSLLRPKSENFGGGGGERNGYATAICTGGKKWGVTKLVYYYEPIGRRVSERTGNRWKSNLEKK